MSSKNSNLVYLYVTTHDEGKPPPYMSWYVFNTETGECLKDENMSNYHFPKHSGCGILNSKIFVVGGQYPYLDVCQLTLDPPLKQVLIYDLAAADQHDKEWKLGKPMHGTRALSAVVPLPRLGNKGRLYVFGCNGFNGAVDIKALATGPWAEYYDAECDEWFKLFEDPPDGFFDESHYSLYNGKIITGSAVYGHGRGSHNIILWSQKCFWIFDAHQGHFLQKYGEYFLSRGPSPRKCIYSPRVVVYDNTLLWFFGSEFLAYDLAENKPFENSVFSFNDYKGYGPDFYLWKRLSKSPFLVRSEKNHLCFIWHDNFKWKRLKPQNGEGSIQIHSIKFEISKSSSGEIVLKPLHYTPLSKRVVGQRIIFAGAQWQDDVERKFDFDASGPQTSCLRDVLEKLPPTMYDLNYGIYLDYNWDTATKMHPEQESKEAPSLDTFLKKLGLQQYIDIFESEEITLRILNLLLPEQFRDLNFPASARRKLRLALQDIGFGVRIGRYRRLPRS